MMRSLVVGCVLGIMAFLHAGSLSAQAPIEGLPPPRVIGTPLPVPPPVPVPVTIYYESARPPRLDSREVWQYYGVDNFGHFRPRVILAPQGAYYLSNGTPYPFVTNRTTNFMPYAVD